MHVFGILHLLYEAPRDLPICVQGLHRHPYGNAGQQPVQINTVVVPKCCLLQSCPFEVVYCYAHYLNCTPTVQGLHGHPYVNVSQQAVQIPTVVVPKCSLRQSAPLCLVYCHARCHHRTTTVQDTTGAPNLCTKVVRESVRQHKAASCIDPYSSCTKTPFVHLGWCIAMRIIGIVPILCDVPRHRQICVQGLWHS